MKSMRRYMPADSAGAQAIAHAEQDFERQEGDLTKRRYGLLGFCLALIALVFLIALLFGGR